MIHRGCGGRGALNPLPLLPLKLIYVADMLPFCGFSAGNRLLCGVVDASTLASWRKYCREWSESLGGGGAAGYGAGGSRVLPLPMAVMVELVIFGFREKNARGAEVRLVLLPLITQGLLRAAPIKSSMANIMGYCCCYR